MNDLESSLPRYTRLISLISSPRSAGSPGAGPAGLALLTRPRIRRGRPGGEASSCRFDGGAAPSLAGRPVCSGFAAFEPERQCAHPRAEPNHGRQLEHIRARRECHDPADPWPLIGDQRRTELPDPLPGLLGRPRCQLVGWPRASQGLSQHLGELAGPLPSIVRRPPRRMLLTSTGPCGTGLSGTGISDVRLMAVQLVIVARLVIVVGWCGVGYDKPAHCDPVWQRSLPGARLAERGREHGLDGWLGRKLRSVPG
jgi:hypothetical protein